MLTDAPPYSALVPPLSPPAELALLARLLDREGFCDHMAGHITYRQPDGSLLVNPFELPWDELTADDVVRISPDGDVLDGRWAVTPAITLHLELYRLRPDVVVAVHNHPFWSTVWANTHRIPPMYDQPSALVDDDLVLYDEYPGDVQAGREARDACRALGSASAVLLANHGVLVVGDSIRQVHHRCVVLEWRSRMAYHVEALGGGVPIAAGPARDIARQADGRHGWPGLFEAMARKELRVDPAILGVPDPHDPPPRGD